MYDPLFAGLRDHEQSAMFFVSVLIWRRVVLVGASMFLAEYNWIQAMLYSASSLVNLAYLGYVMPFDNKDTNSQEILYEGCVLVVSYLAL